VRAAGNGARTTDSSVEERPGVDRRSSRSSDLGPSSEGRALAAGPNAMQVAPSGVHRSKGTDAVRRHRATGTTLATPPRWWRKTFFSPRSDAVGVRLRSTQAVAGAAVTSRGERTRGAPARRAWLATAGGSGKLLGGDSVETRLRLGAKRGQPTCTPGTRRHGWTLWMKPGRSLWHLGAQRWQCRKPSGRRQVSNTVSAVEPARNRRHELRQQVVFRHGPTALSNGSRGRQRQEGNGRSDAVRLSARGVLRRV
jgi:hypothetical protein